MPIEVLLGKAPRMRRDVKSRSKTAAVLSTDGATIADSLDRLLCLPTIADKSFLITIGDRTVGGLISRDQLVGPWQVPVADVAVSLSSYQEYSGEAMAMGERAPVAVLDAPASGRLAVGEAITNILAADIRALSDIRLSANWMAACGEPGEDADLYATVRAVSVELCTALGIAIPVGKDSLSMKTAWTDGGGEHAVIAPVSLVISAFAPVQDARATLTPELDLSQPTRLLLIDLGGGKNRLGGSCWAQVHGKGGGTPADLDSPKRLISLFAALRELKDRGLFSPITTARTAARSSPLLEMAFASSLRLGARLRIRHGCHRRLLRRGTGGCRAGPGAGLAETLRFSKARTQELSPATSASRSQDPKSMLRANGTIVYSASRPALHRRWSEVSFRMQELRDNPDCARQEYSRLEDLGDPGLHASLSFDPGEDVAAPFINTGVRPAIGVLREQGVNSHTEMAAVFTRAGFDAYDVHMTDILAGRVRLARFQAWSPAADSRTAMFWVPARAGQSRSCSTRAHARSSRPSSRATRPSHWACAMAARCCRR